MILKERIAELEKVIKETPKLIFTAPNGTKLDLFLARVNKMYETMEIITLQQEIIEMQQTGLEFYAKFRHCDYSELYEERIESDGQRAKEILEKTKEIMEK